jgi:hypothetical protein
MRAMLALTLLLMTAQVPQVELETQATSMAPRVLALAGGGAFIAGIALSAYGTSLRRPVFAPSVFGGTMQIGTSAGDGQRFQVAGAAMGVVALALCSAALVWLLAQVGTSG